MLAGDYLDGDWLVGTMEAANEGGRLAANVVLAESGSKEPPAAVISHVRLPEWKALRQMDEERYRRREPNMFDSERAAPSP